MIFFLFFPDDLKTIERFKNKHKTGKEKICYQFKSKLQNTQDKNSSLSDTYLENARLIKWNEVLSHND